MWDNSGNHFQLLFVFAAPQCLPLRACSVEHPPPLTDWQCCCLHPCTFSLASVLLFYFLPTKNTSGCCVSSLAHVKFIKLTALGLVLKKVPHLNWRYIFYCILLWGEVWFSSNATNTSGAGKKTLLSSFCFHQGDVQSAFNTQSIDPTAAQNI